MPNKFVEMGKNVVDGFVNGIKNMISGAKQKVVDFFSGIVNGVKDSLKIESPSKVFAYLGQMTGEGYVQGVLEEKNKINNTMDNVFNAFTPDPIDVAYNQSALDNITGSATYQVQSETDKIQIALADGLQEIADTIFSALPNTIQMVLNGTKVAEASFGDFENVATRKGKTFAPTRADITNIVNSMA